ncbi:MBL fold metallo-hydrolase [Arthrobacter sp. AZCC_0090]|uniref:MBL fold metallo-hydrolase n=1 Tax=Arthrobacter sp. AZCC_0090 TaxID=2735881 RepID=UPI00160F7639|nr:MBL fold metallo-hydrolase [Arthrobacter sp. AZCC_0090]MBB6403749.1 L-ascorbate metabolism protein UlaG (beta-lactamase superfamily) [Arthrobacter sp. AZCC_0090]
MNIPQDLQRPTLTHIGGPTILVRYAGLNLLTDPTFDAPGDYPVGAGRSLVKLTGPAVAAEDLGRIDVVLLSHDQHADNLDNSGRELLNDAGMILSTAEAASRIHGVRGLRPWEHVTVQGDAPVAVTAVPALHGPSGAEAVTGEVTGFVLEAEGWPTVYVSGDNASLELAAEISLRFPTTTLAVVFAGAARTPLFGGAPLTLTSQDVVELAGLFPLATVVPVHTEGWVHFTEGPDIVKQRMGDAGLAARLAVLPIGEPHRPSLPQQP